MADTVNRFPGLMDAVRRTADQERATQKVMLAIHDQANAAYWALRGNSPYSTSETLYGTGHAEHHIADSWKIRVGKIRSGARAMLGNTAPHLDMQRYGTDAHPIDAQGPWGLAFWTGSPLMWPSLHIDGHAGWMRRPSVEHPGFGAWGGGDFVKRAAREARPDLIRIAVETGDEIAFAELRRL